RPLHAPPRTEEIILVIRQAGRDRHGLRIRALIAVLWRGGLRISEALALNETDVDERRGSLLIRHGKGDKRRQAGMDEFGFEQLADWEAHRELLAARTAVLRDRRPDPWTALGGHGRSSRTTAARRCGWGAASVCAPPAATCARGRTRARQRWHQHHPAPTGSHRSRYHVDISARHRSQRDHRRRPLAQTTHDLGHRRTRALRTP